MTIAGETALSADGVLACVYTLALDGPLVHGDHIPQQVLQGNG
jgi:hypothetical protein